VSVSAEQLKESMRHWVTGVAIVTSRFKDEIHGMTVNSFTSVSITPPLIVVTLANSTRTYKLVKQSGLFGVTLLGINQKNISDRFAGHIGENQDRFEGLKTFTLEKDIPFINGGLAFFECEVKDTYPMDVSTIFIAEVTSTKKGSGSPLIYHDRGYYGLGE
jgi:flavin reductase (DIM6/NTAB) family NADH-FMN oxidoreductase RutF